MAGTTQNFIRYAGQSAALRVASRHMSSGVFRDAGLLFCAALFVMLAVAAPIKAQQVSPDNLIRNVAEATYFNPAIGVRETVSSNAVEARVSAVMGMDMSGEVDLMLSRGAMDQFFFQLRNTGNADLNMTTSLSLSGDVAAIEQGRLYRDVNENGIIDPQEPQIADGAEMMLPEGEQASFIFAFQVAPDATAGQSARATLMAAAPEGMTASVTSTLTLVDAALELEKLQNVRENDGATYLDYTLRLRNNSNEPISGYAEIDGSPITIDGAPATGVLLNDAIPLNTSFDEVQYAAGMDALFHLRGAGPHTYVTQRPSDQNQIDQIAFFAEGDFAVGRSEDVSFSVASSDGYGTFRVSNTAQTFVVRSGQTVSQQSNTVSTTVSSGAEARMLFIDPETGAEAEYGELGEDTQITVWSGACNTSFEVDTFEVTVVNSRNGDAETVTARETGANTAIFTTAPLSLMQMTSPVSGDGVMAARGGDTLAASATCDGQSLTAELEIGGSRTVFNAMDNTPLSGITIVLLDAQTEREVARVESDELGLFIFEDIPAGRYIFDLADAPRWSFPTVRDALPGYERTVTGAGRGAAFDHDGGTVRVTDLPIDPYYPTPLVLSKTAARDVVATGEFLKYTIDLNNNMYQALIAAQVVDTPSFGLGFVAGSARLNGAVIADAAVSPDGVLTFELGDLPPVSEHELSYLTRVTAAAQEGDLENAALLSGRQAAAGTLRQTPVSVSVVKLDNSGGVFTRKGTIVGSVFMDCDGNGLRGGAGEPGIPGVRLVTQDGLFVVTDLNGKYSIRGLRPVTHALQVQRRTLPTGVRINATRTNDLRRGGSRIVPLRRGEMRAENFAAGACTEANLKSVSDRRAVFDSSNKAGGAKSLVLGAQAVSTRDAAGVATTTQIIGDVDAKASARTVANSVPPTRQSLADLVMTEAAVPAFLNLTDEGALASRVHTFRVKAPADLAVSLMLNDAPLGADRIGEQVISRKRNVQIIEFVAVDFRAGSNTLTMVGRDGFGIERLRQSVSVFAPGEPAKLSVTLPAVATADPSGVVPVKVQILDAAGVVVPSSAVITLAADRSGWNVADIRPETPGVQTYVEGGEVTVGLIPPQASGVDMITVTSAFGRGQAAITFTPNLDEQTLVGIIEGTVAFGGAASGVVLPEGRFSPLEDTKTGLNGSVYFKGAVAGSALVTLRYASDDDGTDQLFRDIDSDAHYPIYGDASETGFDAQSSDNLFVKVERGRAYALYGDISVEPKSNAFKLGGERRVATGAEAFWQNDRLSLSTFAVRTDQTQQIVEIAGRGVSGPYDLELDGYVAGSERVEIIVRDADGGDILSQTPLRRGTDYLLNYFADTITFDAALGQFDIDGNPISARVSYEVRTEGASQYWLYGAEASYALSENTEIGARIFNSDGAADTETRQRLRAAYVAQKRENGGLWETELAQSENGAGRSGNAARLTYELTDQTRDLSFEALHATRDFAAGSGVLRAGTTQVRLSFGQKLSATEVVDFEAKYNRDTVSDTEKLALETLYDRRINDSFVATFGAQVSRDVRTDRTENAAAVILGGAWTPKDQPGTRAEATVKLPVAGNATRDAEVVFGVYRDLEGGGRTYEEAELSFEAEGLSTRMRIGGEYQVTEWLSGSTEVSKAASDTDETASQNIDMAWQFDEHFRVHAGFEHSRKLDTGEDALTSLAVGVDWADFADRYVGDADFDTTWEETGRTHYASVGLAAQVTPDLAVLARSRLALDTRNDERFSRYRTRIGAAYRPLQDPRLEVLAWYEARIEDRDERTQTHLYSVDASFEATDDVRLNGKFAGRHQRIEADGAPTLKARTQLAQAGVAVDVWKDRFQLGLNGAYLFDDAGNSTRGLGGEIGFTPTAGTMVAVGYNHSRGHVSGQSEMYQEGAYLRTTLLLDDSLSTALDGFLGN